jgi:TP901 family phage tail tape measure protein
MSQVKIDFLVTGNLSSLHKQVQTLNAELMAVAGSMTAVDRSMSNIDLQAANAQFGRMLTTSGQFTQQMVTMKSHTDIFSDALARQQLTMRQAFTETKRYVTGRESLIRSLARQQVQMQNSVLMPQGVDSTGRATARVLTPTGLNKDFTTQMRVANKSWEVFNATAQQGATQMVNWGKNTQWAGRQLMVGFTVPLMIAGGLAAKTFKDLDQELVRLQKVYGSGFTFGDDFKKQSEMVRESAIAMTKDMAKAYGQAGTETAALMADLAATGFEGNDLMRMTEQTTKLATLGEVDRQEAMKATVALQSAFKMSTDEVADSVLFLNAVENQTSASLQDLVEAIPRAGTVVEGLGGSVEDLALYMVAMREGGISAAEGANALKSGLSSIIAPPKAATEFMKEFGINLPKIVKDNAGELTPTLMAFQKELQGLDDLARQQVITKLFGKYQFARMNAFFNNLGAQGSQTQKVLDLMGTSMENLGKLADQEVAAQADSVSGQWTRAWETFKINIAEVGEDLLKLGTWALKGLNKVFGFLQDNEWLLQIVKYLGMAAAAIGPVIMLMGLFGNMLGMILKGVLRLSNGFKSMTSGKGISRTFEMLTAESFQADNAIDQLTKSMYDQTTAQKVLTRGIEELKMAYQGLSNTASTTASATAAAAVVAKSDLTGGPWSTTHSGWQSGTVPMSRAHFIPRSLDTSLQTPGMREMLMKEMGYVPPTGRAYNFDTMGWGFASKEQNDIAKDTMPFFSVSRPTGDLRAAADLDKFIAIQSAKIKAALGDTLETQQKINAWKEVTQMEAKAAATNSKDALAAERAYVRAVKSSTELRYGSGYFSDQPTIGTSSNFKGVRYGPGDYAADREVLPSQPRGLSDSWMVADQKLIAATNAATQILEEQAVETKKTGVAQRRYNTMIDSLARHVGDTSANLAQQIPMESVAAAMTRMTQQIDETTIKFQLMESEGQQYLVAIDRATGELMGVSKQMANGGFRAVPGAGVTGVPISARTGDMSESSAKTINALAKQTTDEAMERAAIEKKMHQEAQLHYRNQRLVLEQQKAMEKEELALQREGLKIAQSDLSAEQKIAQLRNSGLLNEEQKLTFTKAGLTAEQASTLEELEQLALEKAQTDAKGSGGWMSKFSGKTAMGVGSAAMMLPMIGSMVAPQDSMISNASNAAMMGSMVGMIGGPWGMAAGAVAAGAASVIYDKVTEAGRKAAEDFKKEWALASQFVGTQLEQEIGEAFNVKKWKTLDFGVSGWINSDFIPQDAPRKLDEFNQKVTDNFSEQIAAMADATAEEAATAAIIIYDKLLMSGMSAEKAKNIIDSIQMQADKKGNILTVQTRLEGVDTRKAAKDSLQSALQQTADSLGSDQLGTWGGGWWWNQDKHEAESNQRAYEWGQSEGEAMTAGLKKGAEPEEVIEEYWNRINKMATTLAEQKGIDWGSLVYQNEDGKTIDLISQFGLSGNMTDDMKTIFGEWSADQRAAFLEALPTQDLREFFEAYRSGAAGVADIVGNSLPNGYDLVYAAQRDVLTGSAALVQTLLDANDAAANLPGIFSAMGDAMPTAFAAMIPEPSVTQEDVDDLIKEQERALAAEERQAERAKEAIQDQQDAIQDQIDLLDKRAAAYQRDIDKIEKYYDREIAQIERAEEKKQAAFDKEEERFQRRQEMRNMEISYEEAIATGQLFEAARIRLDMDAIKKQREQESEREKSAARAEEKIKKLNQKRKEEIAPIKEKLKAIRQENRQLEHQMEVLDRRAEAIDENLDDFRDAQQAELKALKNTVDDEQEEYQNLADKIQRIWENANTNMREKMKRSLELIGADSRGQADAFIKVWESAFGKVGKTAASEIRNSIQSGNWNGITTALIDNMNIDPDLASTLMEWVKNGVPKPTTFKQMMSHRPQDGHATGGFITGPGSGTSDSIPARLSNGEYVIRAASVKKYGKTTLDGINSGSIPAFAKGGIVGDMTNTLTASAMLESASVAAPMAMLVALLKSATGRGGDYDMSAGAPGNYGGTAFSAEQLRNAAIIVSVGKNMGATHRDLIIGLMTAMQESTLHNYKTAVDHDSLGLFQQRPSMGWGTPKQITNPKYASRKFFSRLLAIKDRDQLGLAEAAQRVQVSAYPDAYAKWEDEARAVLSGMSANEGYTKPWVGNYQVGRTLAQHGGTGTDIPMPEGTPLRAVTSGKLTNQPFAFGSYGNWYMLDANGFGFVYAHLSRDKADSGMIKAGQIIGYSGNTGNSFGPHLHFEARRGGSYSNQADPHTLGIPGLRKGGRINYDNTVANLHKGETVLTSALTDKFEKNIANMGGNEYNFDVTIENLSSEVDLERAFERFVVKHERKQQVRSGRSRRI